MNKRKFPCPICKGQGGEREAILDDGNGPYYECGYCEGEGLIEIDGKRHLEIKKENIAMKAICDFKPKKQEWEHKEMMDLGDKIKDLVESFRFSRLNKLA